MSFEFGAVVTERNLELSFTVDHGETVALLGPNGAGKSTVLALAAGLLRPDQGRVVLDDRPLTVTGVQPGPAVWVPTHARRIALLAQDPLLFPHLSVQANVEFAARSRGVRRALARNSARHWLRQVGGAELANRKPAQLSGGQAQRVAIARALAADPRLLLLDEPMAALDVGVTPALRQTLRRVLADRSVILVTHDPLDAMLLADRVLVLGNGRIVEQGPTTDVLTAPRSAFAARIAGLNMLPGSWHRRCVRTGAGTDIHGRADGPTPSDGAPVVAVFPPSAVSVFPNPPGGSPRNVFPVEITEIEPHGGRVRVRAGDLGADITPQALAELDLVPGSRVVFSVKASEVAIYPT